MLIELEIMLPFIYDGSSSVFPNKKMAAYEVKIMLNNENTCLSDTFVPFSTCLNTCSQNSN